MSDYDPGSGSAKRSVRLRIEREVRSSEVKTRIQYVISIMALIPAGMPNIARYSWISGSGIRARAQHAEINVNFWLKSEINPMRN